MSRLLVAIRGERSQPQAARISGLSQSKISRAESGRFPFTPEQAEGYARALDAKPADVRRLRSLAEAFAATHVRSRAALVRSTRATQERVWKLEHESDLIRSWQPEIVVGILQTPAYTQALTANENPTEAWWAVRNERRRLLAEEHRTWHQLMSEAALRWSIGSRQTMAEQMDYLIEASRRPNVQLGIIPFRLDPYPIAAPASFHVYGDRTALAATETGNVFHDLPSDVDHYRDLFGQLDSIAVYGDEARSLLAEISGTFRAH